jgi:outer membrane protein OmpA-like peptidoglycan-associated protein
VAEISPPVTTPSASIPPPREVTYAGNVTLLSSTAKAVLNALVKGLSAGGSITVVRYAYNNRALARERADIVADFLAQHVSVHVTIKIVTTSSVGKVIVITTKL